MRLPALLLLGLALTGPTRAATETYVIDPAHSSVTFTVRHFLAKVPGWFSQFHGTITVDPADYTRNTVTATVDVASVNTNQPKRDDHLRTPDFFDSANHPFATFQSTRWVRTGEDTYAVTGEFTLHGVTRELTLAVRYLGQADGNRGATLTGWEAAATLQRADFRIGHPERAIADEVALLINIEARRQDPQPPTP